MTGARRFARAAVLGVGVIGGSVALALRRCEWADAIVGFGPASSIQEAVALGLIDEAAASVRDAVADADLVVLAAPIPALAELFDQMSGHLKSTVVVTDCASTKSTVLSAAQATLGSMAGRFVAAHPIAGSERHGPGAARDDLFDGCKVMICAQAWTAEDALSDVGAIWASFGAEVVPIDAVEHDALYAELSHWPHAVAFALSAAVAEGPFSAASLRFSGAGLRDTTRIGASPADLWADILLDNRAAVLQSAARFEQELLQLRRAIEQRDRTQLVEVLQRAGDWRRRVR